MPFLICMLGEEISSLFSLKVGYSLLACLTSNVCPPCQVLLCYISMRTVSGAILVPFNYWAFDSGFSRPESSPVACPLH